MGRLQNTIPMPSETVPEPPGSHQDQLFAQQATYPYSIERSMSVLIYPPMRMPLDPRPVPHALVNITPIVSVTTSATRKIAAVVDMSTNSMPTMSSAMGATSNHIFAICCGTARAAAACSSDTRSSTNPVFTLSSADLSSFVRQALCT